MNHDARKPTRTAFSNNISHVLRRKDVTTVVKQTKSVHGPDNTVVVNQTSTSYASPTNLPSNNPTVNESSDSGTPAGPVAGGVVGGVVGLALLIAATWFIYRHIKKKRNTRALDDMYAETGMGGGGVDRNARMRGNQGMMPASNSWETGAPIHTEEDLYHAPAVTQQDVSQTAFASPVHANQLNTEPGKPTAVSIPPSTSVAEIPQDAQSLPQETSMPTENYVYEPVKAYSAGSVPENMYIITDGPSSVMPAYVQEAEQAVDENPQSGTVVSETTNPPTMSRQAPGSLSVNTSHLEGQTHVTEDDKSPLSMYMWLPSHKVAGITSPNQSIRTPAAGTSVPDDIIPTSEHR